MCVHWLVPRLIVSALLLGPAFGPAIGQSYGQTYGQTIATQTHERAADGTHRSNDRALEFDPPVVFDEVVDHVQSHFYRPEALDDDWQARVRQLRQQAVAANSREQFAAVMNDLLATLNASHTHYFSTSDPKRYQLLGVFSAMFDQERSELFVYRGIGIDTQTIDGQTIITAVFDGTAAAKAGLQYGDRIISVDGRPFRGVPSFVGDQVVLEIDRHSQRCKVSVQPQPLDGRTMFETALQDSVRVISSGERSIGYLHVWSYAGQKYQDLVRSELLWGQLAQCDAVIVDLRDGWGGADLNYLNLFRPPIATVEGTSREGKSNSYTGVWERPVALLTNGGSTSGKELFTFGFQKLKRGTVVGETTAGAVLAGRLFLLSSGDVLYLAVSSVKVDGRVLEGVGVKPDVAIARPLDAAGDPQLEKAVELLSTPASNPTQ